MDGVLINSQSALDTLEINFLKGITNNGWTNHDQPSIHGKSIKEVYNLLTSSYDLQISKNVFLERYEDILNIAYGAKCKLNPGVKDFLKHITSKNYKVALASSTAHRFINTVLDKFNLRKYFQVIVSADDTHGKGKPEPDIFLLTADKLGVKPDECLVIEDSNNGIKSAKRAGMFCLEYVKGVYKKAKTFSDLKINTFHNVSINAVCSKLENTKLDMEKISINRNTYYFQLSKEVNKSDYYSDFLLDQLIILIREYKKKNIKLLEVGTGRGYIPIILASQFPQIKKIVAIDIDLKAVMLAKKNIWLNGFESKIELRRGNLYSPLKKNEKFDFIFGALPQIPITKKGVLSLLQEHKNISSYHVTTSVGGANGQKLIKKLIRNAPKYLVKHGLIVEVQADFSFSESLQNLIKTTVFKIHKISRRQKLLKETSLTKILKAHFKKRGYVFKRNKENEEYFRLLCIALKKN